MPETPTPALQYAGTPPGSQSALLQSLQHKPVAITFLGGTTPLLTAKLVAWDAATLTLLVPTPAEGERPMLVYKHAVVSISPA